MNGYRALQQSPGRITATSSVNDLRYAHVIMEYQGQVLLGEIAEQAWLDDDVDVAGWAFRVRCFNGEPWPGCEWVAPARVTVLDRETEVEN